MEINKKINFLAITAMIIALVASIVLATNTLNSPSSCSGSWVNCANANANGGGVATAAVSASSNVTGTWTSYGYSLADAATISSVIVRADFFASKSTGFATVRVSSDGGSTWGAYHVIGGNTVEQTYNIDVTSETAWTGSKLNNSNLKVEVTCYKSGGGANPACSLDWIPVNVTYTVFDYSVSLFPNNSSINITQTAQSTVTVGLVSGSGQNVVLSVSGCPAGASCTLNQTSGTAPYTAVLTMDTSGMTNANMIYNINVSANSSGLLRSSIYKLTVFDSMPSSRPSATPTSGSAPLVVDFTGTVVGGNSPITYSWDFGDGVGTSTQQNPQYNYTVPGVYHASLTATDNDGDSDLKNVNITVS